jgi:hypothetical protein
MRHVPLFNSAVLFTVPRFHEVTPVTAARPRYSIFGWFLQRGRSYDLLLADAPAKVGGKEGATGKQQPPEEAKNDDTEQLPEEAKEGAEDGGMEQRSEAAKEGAKMRQQHQHPARRLEAARARRKKRRREGATGVASGERGDAAREDPAPQCRLARRLLAKLARKKGPSNSQVLDV